MVPIGCRALDQLLGGGIAKKMLTQIYGPAGSGKTNIALQALVNAVKIGKKAIFIDTEGSFNEKRLRQIAAKSYEEVLKNTILYEITSFEEQDKVIKNLKRADFVIVDSISSLYRLERDESNVKEINRLMGKQMNSLLQYARTYDVPVLVTNQVYENFDSGRVEPVGGDTVKYDSKVIVELQKNGGDGRRKAILRKHLFKKEGEEALFRIVGSGIVDDE
ncbi:DNA repair and recombination protein RadB [Candidatus Micrarchaeota archaeon]|nr:MAG: DNA repair and recombination protein RadB [Candidatus Micrarchaeota archaeon]